MNIERLSPTTKNESLWAIVLDNEMIQGSTKLIYYSMIIKNFLVTMHHVIHIYSSSCTLEIMAFNEFLGQGQEKENIQWEQF